MSMVTCQIRKGQARRYIMVPVLYTSLFPYSTSLFSFKKQSVRSVEILTEMSR